MKKTRTQRLSEKGLFLSAKEITQLQEKGALSLIIPLAQESAYFAMGFSEWIHTAQGEIKVELPAPKNSVWLKTNLIAFEYGSVFQHLKCPSYLCVIVLNEISKS